ncbi:MAG: A/G-specific adenine glycosylase [Gammaproteobacteria bacterium]|nr:A/G-specific adenine glycosylase [Gammaproteobacteria bacterium]NIO61757.1 A/G-specific adenine glycosylase [Gammaproteobacteria bacterium]NIP48627.1 A/G-specific adenine glycosylase [Gammaproteobacteria bacterium]NIQ09079.1 A/G-specific adenine glycosylase [Gammaproteobacteria bacterium]NIQ19008.1 A/G-specific adenine glycosylase [Gammaproteobacteria bacterium]
MADNKLARKILAWFEHHGRHNLPWQENPTPYRVWVSEIMLQQTQVNTVIPYYQRFMIRFPDVASLARAKQDEILHFWTGLGYYARARNLHRAAREIVQSHQGHFPQTLEGLMALPGIGRSTAGAIFSLAMGQRAVILDGNVKRVLARYHAVTGWPGMVAVQNQLWTLADEHTPAQRVAEYTQAIMDLGATICVRRDPRCESCPLRNSCLASAQGNPNDYPGSRAAKSKPVRKVLFAVLKNQFNEVLLEQRSPNGVWGGLWSFPEHGSDFDIQGWITHDLGLVIEKLDYRPLFRHTFSHFHLDITPVHIQVSSAGDRIRDPGKYCWYHPAKDQRLGMPRPVCQIMQQLET